jgi:hypothetical protein
MTTDPTVPSPLSPEEIAEQIERDIVAIKVAAMEYEDSADACDTPGLAAFRLRRRTQARHLRGAAGRIAALLAELERLRGARERLVADAVMEAIEQTIKLCDTHERERRPMEDRCVDYAGILAGAEKYAEQQARARSSLVPDTPTRRETEREMDELRHNVVDFEVES